MCRARQRFEWDKTGAVLAMLYNINRDPSKSQPAKSADFNPYAPQPQPLVIPFAQLCQMMSP